MIWGELRRLKNFGKEKGQVLLFLVGVCACHTHIYMLFQMIKCASVLLK